MTAVATNHLDTLAHTRKLAQVGPRVLLVVLVVVVLLAMLSVVQSSAFGQDDSRSTVLLRDAVMLAPGTVKLSDVAELSGASALSLSELTIVELPAGRGGADVTLEQVCAALDKAGVNRARVEIHGYARCRVKILSPAAPQQPVPADAPVTTDPARPAQQAVVSPTSLRAQVTAMLERSAGGDAQDLRITFADADARVLDQDVSNLRMEFEPIASSSLGRVPLVVRAYQGDKPVQTIRLIADVARRMDVLTIARSVARGQVLQADDVKSQKLFVTDARNAPIVDPAMVVGQLAVAALRPGTVITSEHVRSPILVKKGDTVMVRCIAGGLVITTPARATEDGFADKRITLINERSRETFTARVTGPREAVIVVADSLLEAAAPAQAKPGQFTAPQVAPAPTTINSANRGGA
jgi:flagella basal body P-ring formation protein FlgA